MRVTIRAIAGAVATAILVGGCASGSSGAAGLQTDSDQPRPSAAPGSFRDSAVQAATNARDKALFTAMLASVAWR